MEKCEICGKKLAYKGAYRKCQICGKIMCLPCSRVLYNDVIVCGNCYADLDVYFRQIDCIKDECDARIAEVWDEIERLIKYE